MGRFDFSVRLNLVLSEVMGAREYVPPQDVKELLVDFYTLEQIKAAIYSGASFPISPELENKLVRETEYLQRTLVPYIREHLLDKAGFSIACELRHFYDTTELKSKLVHEMRDDYDEEEDDYREDDYREEDDNYNEEEWDEKRNLLIRFGMDRALADLLYFAARQDTRNPLVSLSRPQHHQCAHVGRTAFVPDYVEWRKLYGGKPWAVACEVWLQLYNAKSLRDQTQWIDQMYSVEHNSGSLLNKNPGYEGKWLKYILDLKKEANDPTELLRFASPYMRRVALFVNKARYGKTFQASGRSRLKSSKFTGVRHHEMIGRALEKLTEAGFKCDGFTPDSRVLRVSDPVENRYIAAIYRDEDALNCVLYEPIFPNSEQTKNFDDRDPRTPDAIVRFIIDHQKTRQQMVQRPGVVDELPTPA